MGQLLPDSGHENTPETAGSMDTPTDQNVYMETMEESQDAVCEPNEIGGIEDKGMAMGKYPEKLLADCKQPYLGENN